MAAMVQTFSPQAPTMTMLPSRSPSSDAYQNTPRNAQRTSHAPHNIYSPSASGMVTNQYRGHTTSSPIPPYAFTSTPGVNPAGRANPLQQHPPPAHPRLENRTASAPVVPQVQQPASASSTISARPPVLSLPFQPHGLGPSEPSPASTLAKPLHQRPLSSIELNPPALAAATGTGNPAKPSPDRYRRVQRRADTVGGGSNAQTLPAGPGGAAPAAKLYMHPTQASSSPTLSPYPAYRGQQSPFAPNAAMFPAMPSRSPTRDDMSIPRPAHEVASRYRRRSVSGLDPSEHGAEPRGPTIGTSSPASAAPKSYAAMLAGPAPTTPQTQLESRVSHTYPRPGSSHERQGSAASSSSGRSSPRSASVRSPHPRASFRRDRDGRPSRLGGNTTSTANVNHQGKRDGAAPIPASTPAAQPSYPITPNQVKLVNIPPRGSSDANKRIANPSPLSKPVAMSPEPTRSNDPTVADAVHGKAAPSGDHGDDAPAPPGLDSPAAQHLAAVSKKDDKKQAKSSRLRRAFSFGSAAELRKASAENSVTAGERGKLRKSQYATDEAQQAAIAQKQEASGLGEGIYSGQGNFFTGSTDNLSISSTASSASVMIRKMGKGVKRGSRSLVGLFRPKSVVGVPPPDAALEPSVAQVSMVTVEAEREKVNVNANPSEQSGGGTGFPKLERNSLDAMSVANETVSVRSDGTSRRSIVGGEKERAEVLAAVKKGILKRSSHPPPLFLWGSAYGG